MARFYADENFPLPVVEELRRSGHNVLTLQEDGLGGQAVVDETVLSIASQADRTLLTLNRKHFIALHNRQPDHAGIVVCSFDPDFCGQARRIHAAITDLPGVTGQLIRINRPESI